MPPDPRAGLPVLHEESFAPWCEKARWALDAAGIAYRRREHIPLLGEVVLRVASGQRLRDRVSVPLLVLEDQVIMDSYLIARHAHLHRRQGPGLFPEGQDAVLDEWNAQGERVMQAGRCLLLYRLRHMPRALSEQIPLPSRLLRRLFRPVSRGAVTFLAWKYRIRHDAESARTTLIAALEDLRGALELGGGYLVDSRFTIADVCMATSLQFIQPVSNRYIALGREQRLAWTDLHLARDFADLLRWRDGIYRLHRHAVPAGGPVAAARDGVGTTTP